MIVENLEAEEVADSWCFSWMTLKQALDICMKVDILFLVPREDSIPAISLYSN